MIARARKQESRVKDHFELRGLSAVAAGAHRPSWHALRAKRLRIDCTRDSPRYGHLVTCMLRSVGVPSQETVLAKWRDKLTSGTKYEKFALMHAIECKESGTLETILNGKVETTNGYTAGDLIVLGTEGERFVLSAEKFQERYDVASAQAPADAALASQGYKAYTPTGQAWAQQLDERAIAANFPEGKFMAPWGSEIIIEPGDWLATTAPLANDIYRIERNAFRNTYKPM